MKILCNKLGYYVKYESECLAKNRLGKAFDELLKSQDGLLLTGDANEYVGHLQARIQTINASFPRCKPIEMEVSEFDTRDCRFYHLRADQYPVGHLRLCTIKDKLEFNN